MFDDEIVQELSAITYKLLPSVAHEINNSLQVVRGALGLAAEDLYDPEELGTYIHLCLAETESVVALINYLRIIPNITLETREIIDINQYLKEAFVLLRKYLSQRQIQLLNEISSEKMWVEDVFSLRHLLLFILMRVIDVLAENGGGEFYILSQRQAGNVEIQLSTKNLQTLDFQHSVDAGENFSDLIAKLIVENELELAKFEVDGKNYLKFSLPLVSVD